MKTKYILFITFLFSTLFIFPQIEDTSQQTAQGIFSILEFFGVVIKEPIKALILLLVPILLRFFERKNLTETINKQNEVLEAAGFVRTKHKTFFKKIWDKIRRK